MKRMKKFIVLFTMLFASFSFMGANNANKMVVADAATSGSSAYLSSDWKTKISMLSSVNHLLITNDISKVPTSYWVGPVDVDTDSSNTIIKAYVSMNNTTSKLECVLYADVEMIYAQSGSFLFASLSNVENIIFDCKFSMAFAEDASTHAMFVDNTQLAQIDGLANLDTSNVTDMSYMFGNCQKLTSLDVDGFNTSNATTMEGMFNYCNKMTSINGLEHWDTYRVTDMKSMFYECESLTTLNLSGFYLFAITDGTKLDGMLGNLKSLIEIKAPGYLNGHTTITLPSGFYTNVLDSSMQNMTLIRGAKELNDLVNTLRYLQTCSDYMQGPELQAIYDALCNEDKVTFSALKDYDDVLLTEKLAYMVYLAEAKTKAATSETYMTISPITSQYLVMIIACLSLTLIGIYYFFQKKKYAK